MNGVWPHCRSRIVPDLTTRKCRTKMHKVSSGKLLKGVIRAVLALLYL